MLSTRPLVFFIRGYASKAKVRVRFAPSPTGFLHLGGLRTALYNYLFAKSKNGVFILRIEDTDQTRLVPGATQQLVDDLEYVGIIPDEGPNGRGDHGPYVQSERLHFYREAAEKLIESQSAYYCFCTETRLELLRKDAIRHRRVPKYDNRCRHLSPKAVREKILAGSSKCVRFKLIPSEPYVDLIYGTINHEVHEIEGDPVILKADGWPTYHLANVVDDHRMEISHVIRGVEWIQSTNKHLMIYKAFGYSPPNFAHLPLLLNPDGSKLSKRQGDLTIRTLRERGIYPLALANFVLQAGSGFDSKSEGLQPMDQLVSKFQLSKVSTNSCRLPFDRLPDFNRADIEQQLRSPVDRQKLISRVQHLVSKSANQIRDVEAVHPDDAFIVKTLEWCLPRISTLDELVGDDLKFLWFMPSASSLENISAGMS
ncbi:unnamed protein product [Nesidiocoris tenuis]|uniref:Nondiscriminating glutamyl-tRNA synthetase EARS2, mitochondrial n=1 Tax=Nesidiocoris tenuis TaxID=355587 RepID=A0A6H5HP42_9HEMI|nr:unnamed protein product [Nesidiocoris tenuis]